MITYSAIKFFTTYENKTSPVIMTGLRHADIYENIYYSNIPVDEGLGFTEGFLTHDNRFLNRVEARLEALKCNQIHQESSELYPALYSEDIWPEE